MGTSGFTPCFPLTKPDGFRLPGIFTQTLRTLALLSSCLAFQWESFQRWQQEGGQLPYAPASRRRTSLVCVWVCVGVFDVYRCLVQ